MINPKKEQQYSSHEHNMDRGGPRACQFPGKGDGQRKTKKAHSDVFLRI